MLSPLSAASAFASAGMVGLIPTLVESTEPRLLKQLATPRLRIGLSTVFFLTWLPAMPAAGWLLDRFGNQELLFFGLLGIVLAVAWLARARTPNGAIAVAALLGGAYSLTAVAAVRVMTTALAFGDSRVGALNIGFIGVGLGALLGPVLINWAERFWGYRQGLLIVGLSFLVPAVLVVMGRTEAPPLPVDTSVVDALPLALLVVIVLIYFAIETCLDVWPTPYLRELGHSPSGVRFNLAVFWGGFLLSRLALGWFAPHHYDVSLLLALVLLSAFALGNLVGAYGASSGSLGLWIVGLAYGPLLPGFLALVPDFCPARPATVTGILLALSGLDTILFRPFVVAASGRQPARAVMRVPTILALLLAAPLLVLALLRG